MYKENYLRASEIADRLQEDPAKQERLKQREGIMSRISAKGEEAMYSGGLDIAKSLARIRQKAKESSPKIEGGSVTGMALPDTGELPEGVTRPIARGQGTKPVKKADGDEFLLMSLIDQTEAGGDYTTLFDYSQRDGRRFAGVDVTKMSIGELKNFANDEYGKWSKEKLGYKATPMGRYQIVGTTLAQTAKELGLDDDTIFTPEVQDRMFLHLATKNKNNLRGTWEGLKHVSNSQLNAAIKELERL